MSVSASTTKPKALLAALYKAIDEGHIQTWRYQDVGNVRWLTHSAKQWDALAWFKATVVAGGIVFNISPPPKKTLTTEVYAVYHGRLIEMLIAHFGESLTQTAASPLPVAGDVIKAA